ncbi:hypothetical protein ZWY2020_018086 [Hordeum vulgare]|nr:hypothetical protein ZWY2020_018086 [Hordeum vulgare]
MSPPPPRPDNPRRRRPATARRPPPSASGVGLPATSRALRRRPCLGSASAPATSPLACCRGLAGAAAALWPSRLPRPASSRDHGQPPRGQGSRRPHGVLRPQPLSVRALGHAGELPQPGGNKQFEAIDRSWRDWEDDGDWIWEDGGANPRVATTTAAIVDDPSSMGIYITRWSAKRLREIANTVKEKKRDVISKSSFGDLLHISPLPPPPEELVDFIVMRIDTKKRLLKLSDHKKIQFTRDMVKKLFNMPSGSKPLEFGKRGKADFREIYLEGERAPIPTTVIYMDHIDIPRGCIVDHVIDYSLPRACFVKELDFTAVIAVDTIEDGFGKRPFSSTSPYATTKFLSYIEQLAKLPNKASMSATEILDMVGADGVQQPTEGATNKADGTTRNVHEPPPKNTEGGDDVCGSLEDWLHPLPAFDELESKLCVDPSSFNTNSCTKDLKRACEKNDIAKADQFNVFDSNIRDSDYVSILEKPCSNLIENFKTLVRGRNPWKHNLDMFERFSPSGYPHQSTTFDCGLFAILYMENLTARGLKPFNTDTTSLLNFRKYIAAKLFKHPQNTLSSEEELEKLLKKS